MVEAPNRAVTRMVEKCIVDDLRWCVGLLKLWMKIDL